MLFIVKHTISEYIPPWEKSSNTIITHNAKLMGTYVLWNNIDLYFCNPVIPFIEYWFYLYLWCYIIHRATHEYWFPMTLSEVVTIFQWWRSQVQVLSRICRKVWTIICFLLCWIYYFGFCNMNIKQYVFQHCLLLNSLCSNHCIPIKELFYFNITCTLPSIHCHQWRRL